MSLTPAAREYLLALADDEHMIGARHTTWIGLGPFLEEDLAFCSIAQDELGHAIGLYELLLDDAGTDRTQLDAFALQRAPGEYRSCWLAEIECPDWSDSLVRHWLYDRAEDLRWKALESCTDPVVAALSLRAQREESFHLAHAEQFLSRLASTDQSARIVASIERLMPIAFGLFDSVASEPEMLAEGFVAQSSADMEVLWIEAILDDLKRWDLDVDIVAGPGQFNDQRRTIRSDGFVAFQADLLKVISLDPVAVW
jgi:ring-1,2-phenylacetyl-CoA epoxidase subunit PaaC